MKKRIISGLLSFALLLSCYSVVYSAEPITTEDGFVIDTITVSGKELLAVVGYTGTNKYVKIPSFRGYEKIEAIGGGAFRDSNIESVELHNSIEYIGSSAFINCAKLKSVVIPSSVTSINDDAFKGNRNLKTVIISNGTKLRSLQRGVFSECDSLESITIPKEVSYIDPDIISGNDTFVVYGNDWIESEGFYLGGVYYPMLKKSAAQAYANKFYYDYIPSLDYSITDVNMDKTTDLDDVTWALKYALTIDRPLTLDKYFADTNSDGEITLDDVMKILKVALSIESI